MDQSIGVGFLERIAGLSEYVNYPARRQRASLAYQRLQIKSLKKLHHDVNRLVFGHAEVVDLHGMGRSQIRGGLCLTAESCDRDLSLIGSSRPQHLGSDQFDRRRA